MNYNTFEASTDLKSFIKCYWTLEAPKESNPEKQRIVPDGCMEMIFHYGDLYKQSIEDGGQFIQPRCFVFGQITKPLEIEPTGKTGIFAVRFQPEGFTPFCTIPLSEMENKAVSLQDLFGSEGKKLEQEILKLQTTADRIKTVESFLLSRTLSSNYIDNIAKSSVEIILQLKGQLEVDDITNQLNVNRRQLERKFSSVVGLSPKQLSKIIRLQSALKMLAANAHPSLTAVAYDAGYYDQAHFIKDFKEFTGMSPKMFYAGNLKFSSLFSSSE